MRPFFDARTRLTKYGGLCTAYNSWLETGSLYECTADIALHAADDSRSSEGLHLEIPSANPDP